MSDTLKRKLVRKIKAAPAKRIAQIILPKADNDGNSLTWHHVQYQKAFAHCYGGFTAYDVHGGWMHEGRVMQDASVSYHIAMHDDDGDMSGDVVKLRQLAQAAAKELKQECIFIVLPCGDVEFVTE